MPVTVISLMPEASRDLGHGKSLQVIGPKLAILWKGSQETLQACSTWCSVGDVVRILRAKLKSRLCHFGASRACAVSGLTSRVGLQSLSSGWSSCTRADSVYRV